MLHPLIPRKCQRLADIILVEKTFLAASRAVALL
jgi:hypothetical protein